MKTITVSLYAALALMLWSAMVIAATSDPEQLMRETTERILAKLDASPALRDDRPGLIGLIEKEVFPLVDFPRASRLILGRHWPKAGEEQQGRFVEEIKKLLACTYSTAFANYRDQKVEFEKPRWSEDRSDVEIRTSITQAGSPPIPVSYRLRNSDNQWKLYDLTVEGISLVANYRATFAQQLERQDLDALIADLGQRSAKDCKTEG
ncbi:MAG: ABC transporter substrate-binding protein [Thiohalobacteraceae bacterium]